jgi:hypothetical protein
MSDVQQVEGKRHGRNGHRKVRLITRDALDRRTTASKMFDNVVLNIANDLGGEDRLSTIQKHLIESFASVALLAGDTTAHMLQGEEVDVLQFATVISTMVRTAQRLGVGRVAKNIEQSCEDVINEHAITAD